jgi:beta-phosphoglucomutase-like phosphatase (HAD superfamily)
MTEDPLSNIEAVILDMDGVIVDSEPLHEQAQEIVFDEFGLDVPSWEHRTFKGRTERDVFGYVLDRYGEGRDIDLGLIVGRKHAVYRELLEHARSVDGAIDFIRRISGELPLGLTTSAASTEQLRVFDLFTLDGLFDAIVTADNVTNSKPHPEPYILTLEALGSKPSRTLVVEDSLLGVKSALSGLVGTFTSEELETVSPHLISHSFNDFRSLGDGYATHRGVA